jgi:hypothetical protein
LASSEVDAISRPLSSQHHLVRPLSVALDFFSFQNSIKSKNVPTMTLDPNEDPEFSELSELQSQSESCSQQSDCKRRTWYDLLATTHSTTTDTDYHHLLNDIDNAVANCVSPLTRLDLYAEGSLLGHIESLYKWSMLLGFGSEIPSNSCGIEEFTPSAQQYHRVVYAPDE